MDDIHNKGRNQHTIPGVLRDPSGKAVQPQPVSYETTPMSEDDVQSSLIYAQDSFGIPGGAETFIKARPSTPPVQPSKSLSQPASPPVPPKAISQRLRADPSYQVLAVAVVAVLLASSVLAAFVATGGLSAIANNHANQPLTKAQVTATTRSTQGHTTTAPKPTSTPGSTQAPTSATPQPTQSPSNSGGTPPPNSDGSPPQTTSGTVLIQFINLPQQISMTVSDVSANRTYTITVQTQPNSKIFFLNAFPPDTSEFGRGGTQSDGSGTDSFNWYPYGYGDFYLDQPASFPVVIIASVTNNNGSVGQVQATITFVITP